MGSVEAAQAALDAAAEGEGQLPPPVCTLGVIAPDGVTRLTVTRYAKDKAAASTGNLPSMANSLALQKREHSARHLQSMLAAKPKTRPRRNTLQRTTSEASADLRAEDVAIGETVTLKQQSSKEALEARLARRRQAELGQVDEEPWDET